MKLTTRFYEHEVAGTEPIGSPIDLINFLAFDHELQRRRHRLNIAFAAFKPRENKTSRCRRRPLSAKMTCHAKERGAHVSTSKYWPIMRREHFSPSQVKFP